MERPTWMPTRHTARLGPRWMVRDRRCLPLLRPLIPSAGAVCYLTLLETVSAAISLAGFDIWEQRAASAKDCELLRPLDAFFLEFDSLVKAYYFGEEKNHWEYALWNKFNEFVHPLGARARSGAEAYGDHVQATKRFDLWKVPDVFVVHLKRFNGGRMLRDKINTLIDFSRGIGPDPNRQRSVGKRLEDSAGVDVESLGLKDLEEPLVYDLFAVDDSNIHPWT
ncbi:hypothetical protein LXA43DRAFT_666811 [Ganoderma leucocontextum]|nr:hypothetical protein LXA43DRAFT_666811 [Ganoderma leucocontextum]